MIYTELTNKAIKLAYNAHHGQVDKAGMPYILHPYHLAEQMTDEISTCVALLHDVVEDTDITFEDLAKEFPPEVIKPLKLLTHAEGTDYFEYVKALKPDSVARAVKLADIAHNSDESRLAGCEGITDGMRVYFRDKYTRAKAILDEEYSMNFADKSFGLKIRQEQETDCEEVHALIKEAFATAEHADGNEQDLVAALRKGDAFVPELSLVAEIDGKLAGHILFTKAKVGARDVLALAPLSVKPEYQKRGVGAALIGEGHRLAGELGYEYSIVLGSEVYYPRFGYIPAEELGVALPEGFPPENFMAAKLLDNAEKMDGNMVYAAEFGL